MFAVVKRQTPFTENHSQAAWYIWQFGNLRIHGELWRYLRAPL